MRLVLRVHFIAKGLAARIEHTGAIFSRDVLPQAFEHIDYPVQCSGGLALGITQVWHGMVGPIQITGTIHKQ